MISLLFLFEACGQAHWLRPTFLSGSLGQQRKAYTSTLAHRLMLINHTKLDLLITDHIYLIKSEQYQDSDRIASVLTSVFAFAVWRQR